ncbi:MAG: hydroxyacylglutathione hydrolase [Sedimentisphaerales bacterium]|nr:hydroxyacylglutathione hydrolase [Sedimentisphaerales bacterium]
MNGVIVLRAMGDNYIYLVRYAENRCLIIDPGTAEPVIVTCEEKKIIPAYILLTHHHSDHAGGVAILKNRYRNVEVTKPAQSHKDLQREMDGIKVRIIPTPGHTKDGVCYLISSPDAPTGALFTGDTLFIAGCGRALETDMKTLYESLQKLSSLPDDTLIYPGHDYTEENYRFALTIEPDNPHVQQAMDTIRRQQCPAPHVPSTLRKEKQTNPFLRAPDAEEFARRRLRKDRF